MYWYKNNFLKIKNIYYFNIFLIKNNLKCNQQDSIRAEYYSNKKRVIILKYFNIQWALYGTNIDGRMKWSGPFMPGEAVMTVSIVDSKQVFEKNTVQRSVSIF